MLTDLRQGEGGKKRGRESGSYLCRSFDLLLTAVVWGIKEAETETESKTEVNLINVCHASKMFALHKQLDYTREY